MRRFRRWPVRRKLLVVTLVGIMISLILMFIGIFAYEVVTYQRRLAQEMTNTATFIASSSAPPLAFDDSKTAQEILATMKSFPSVKTVALYTVAGNVFASYARDNQEVISPLPQSDSEGLKFVGRDLLLFQNIEEKGRHLGALYLKADTASLRARLASYTGIVLVMLLAITGSGFFLERLLSRLISGPILRLSLAAVKIAGGDLGTRVPVESADDSKDEINQLARAFNHMTTKLSALVSRERESRSHAEAAVQVRDDFLSIAAHELRTPLTPMKMNLYVIKKNLKGFDANDTKAKQLLQLTEKSEQQLERITRLVEDLLDVARISHGQLTLNMEECDFGETVREVIEELRNELKKNGCTLTLQIEEGVRGRCDRLRFEQVVINLLTNAIKYGAQKPIEIQLTRGGDWVRISVKDHGIGISKQDQQQIFEKFERAVPLTAYGGLGLGLFICKQIVDAHRGRISVVSEEKMGATFIVELPLGISLIEN